MGDDLLAYGVAKMKSYAVVEGGDAKTRGLLTMTDARWQSTLAFLQTSGLAKPNVDYSKAWTLDIVNDVKVLP